MATLSKKPAGASAAKPAKMIDLTKEKTSPAVTKFVNRVNKLFVMFLKKTNVPVFMAMAKNASAESFFLDYDTYKAVFGEIGIQLFEQCFLTALNTAIADDVTAAIDKSAAFVGLWDSHTIYDIVTNATTIMVGDEDGRRYFTAHQYHTISSEDLAKLEVGTYMPFDEYNPNRFYQQVYHIIGLSVAIVKNIIKNRWPKLYYSDETSVVTGRFYATLGAYLRDANVSKIDTSEEYAERTVRQFMDELDKPLMTMTAALLDDSGLSHATVLSFLSSIKLHLVYNESASGKIGDTTVTMMLVAESLNGKPGVSFDITIKDLMVCYEACLEGEQASKTRIEKFEKAIKRYVNDLCMLAIKVYIETAMSDIVQES